MLTRLPCIGSDMARHLVCHMVCHTVSPRPCSKHDLFLCCTSMHSVLHDYLLCLPHKASSMSVYTCDYVVTMTQRFWDILCSYTAKSDQKLSKMLSNTLLSARSPDMPLTMDQINALCQLSFPDGFRSANQQRLSASIVLFLTKTLLCWIQKILWYSRRVIWAVFLPTQYWC